MTIARNCYLDYLRKNNKELQYIDINEFSDKLSIEYDYLKNVSCTISSVVSLLQVILKRNFDTNG